MSRFGAIVGGLVLGWWLGSRAGRRPASARAVDPVEFEFLSLMSHELKTPINIITGYLELLEDDIPDPLPRSAREHVHQARVAAARMADLVNDLLTWTRLRSRQARFHIERVTAAEIIRNASGPLVEQAGARGLRLEVDVPPDLWLWTDPVKACQALRALVTNGLKFTDQGTVRVTADRRDDRVRFHVTDTGIGIAPEHLEAIFEPYWQLEGSVRRTHGGVGIGLTVARHLARLLGGDVTVRSLPGDGSEFVLDLPVGSGDARTPERSPARHAEERS